MPLGPQGLGRAEKTLANGNPVGARRADQRCFEGFGGLGRANVAQGACGGLRRAGIGCGEQFGYRLDGLGVAAHAEAADHAQQRPALDRSQGVAEGLVYGRVGDRLHGIAGHVRELFVAQQGGQRGDGLLCGDSGELTAGG